MDLKEGDLVITLDKVEKIRAIIDEIKGGMIGVVVDDGAKFDNTSVYGVSINGRIYYLFEDEIEKLEEKC